jgi:protein-disulfide isomerase
MLVTLGAAPGTAGAERSAVPGAAGVAALLKGIPQHGAWLGRSNARLTLVEYVDVQCPFCARYSRDVFPTVVRRYVRTGRVRILFRGIAFVGSDSLTGLRWVVAGGRQNHLWDMLEVLFANQGRENSGWLTQERLVATARSIRGVNVAQLRRESASAGVLAEIRAAARAANSDAVPGTPFFEAGRSIVGMTPVKLRSFDPGDFTKQLDALLDE